MGKGAGGGGINNLIHYLLCKAHQHCYTMATIELLIAFLSYPPGENAHAPLCDLSLPAQRRAGERQRERESETPSRVECLPPRSNYNTAI